MYAWVNEVLGVTTPYAGASRTPVRPAHPAMLLTVTGGAGAGKTTLAAALAGRCEPATVLHLDDYYHFTDPDRGSWVPDETGTPRLDVGDPRSIDFARLNSDAVAALATSTVVIIEGLFAIHANPAAPHTRFDVFVDLAADLRLARKIHRKCVRDGFPVEVLLTNYLSHRRPAHDRYTEPARHESDLIVNSELPADRLAAQIWQAISDSNSKRRPL